MQILRVTLGGGLLLFSSTSQAHSFGAGTDFFAAFIEGTKLILFEPITLFACLSLGLLMTMWRPNGLVVALPYLIGATVLGFLTATSAPAGSISALLTIGTISAVLAAVIAHNSKLVVLAASIATGILCLFVALDGHEWMELSAAIYLGLIIGTYFCVAVAAALAQALLERFKTAQWSRITVRVAASWLAATQILLLAFQFVEPVTGK